MALLARKRLLRKLFTQNIDCLERAAGVPSDLIVEAHGSFASQRCVDCKAPFLDDEAMRAHVARGEPPLCPREGCTTGIIKPDIVFFGEQLPASFFAEREVPSEADLLLVLGTSLSVQPFASLPLFAGDDVPRVLFNLQRVGDLGSRPDDVLCLGSCDAGVRRLADALGWRDELERLWEDTVGAEEAQRQRNGNAGTGTNAGVLDDEVREISEAVEHRLKLDPTSPPFAPASASVSVPGQDHVTQEATAFTNDQRGQGAEAKREKEELVDGKDHGGDGRQAHASDAPARAAIGAAPGAAEAGTAEGGGNGAGGGVETEDQRTQEDAEAAITTTAVGETGQQRREQKEPETETAQAMPSDALATSPSTSAPAPAPPAAEQQQPQTPPPKKKKVMIATDSPEVIEAPPLPAEDEAEADTEAEVSLPPPPSPPLLPRVVPGDAARPAADANAAATASEEGAAQPMSTLPALEDPPREKVYSEIVSGDGAGKP